MDGFSGEPSRGCRTRTVKRMRSDDRNPDGIKLERVLGVTVTTNAALDSDPTGKIVAYPAGCTVVLLNTQTEEQNHIINTSKKSISSLAFSSCGRYLVTGECGHQPAVRVWDLQSDPRPGHPGLFPQYQQVGEILSHTSGISCVAFSPTGKYVVSVGTQHDMLVNVWEWRNNTKIAGNKVSTKVKALAFAENGSYFVTVGNRHVKFWFLEYGKTKYKEAVPLMGRSAILGEQRNNYFCDVACGKAQCGDNTYAITRSGLLCEFNNRRLLDKWVELRTTRANCLAVGEQSIFVGCADGIVRCFDALTLRFVTTLPRTHYLGVNVSEGLNIAHMLAAPSAAKYPDTTAITYNEMGNKLTCIYNDHSLYVWDVHNIERVGKSQSYLYHSACIWGVEMAPPQSPLPPGSFLTCSSDDTIRVWNLNKLTEKNSRGIYKRNIYSNELVKIIYVKEDLTFLKDMDVTYGAGSNEKLDTMYDVRNGVRCIRLSPDGKHLASGDRVGTIRIHDTTSMKVILKLEAHDAEVLCLEYSGMDSGAQMMASASRDRLIHVFDVSEDYHLLQSLDDHSSSITAVKLVSPTHGNLQMVTCGADKCLLFRTLGRSPSGTPQFIREHTATGKTTLYDMEVDNLQKHVLTACQDRNVRVYNVNTGKHTKTFKGSSGDDGTLIKVVLDRSGLYLATSCTDKSLSVYDNYTGECMVTMCGHSELATGLRFTNDCRHLISASGDGCIFVWRVPHDMVVTMHARLGQHAIRMGKPLDLDLPPVDKAEFFEQSLLSPDKNLNLSKLPRWARKFMTSDNNPSTSDSTLPTANKEVAAPKGRWAERAGKNVPLSIYTGSPQSSESSLDSGTDFNQYSETRRGILLSQQDDEFAPENFNDINQPVSASTPLAKRNDVRRTHLTDDSALGSLRDPDNESTAHDGDIDSDHEYRQLYYPTMVDLASGSEFTVTNIDSEELRRSVRKSKRKNLPPIAIPKPSPTQESDDDDDDDASTPSGENTDRNSMSLLSVSSESLDQLAYREKYLQSTFESLSSAEIDAPPAGTSSISSQYHTRTNSGEKLRNVAVINAAKLTKYNPEAVKKREELTKNIADIRKKLANVGYISPMRYSKSIHDLSHIPEKDKSNGPMRKQGNESGLKDCSCFELPDPTHHYQINRSDFPYSINDVNDSESSNVPNSFSLPTNLQLCGCHVRDVLDDQAQICTSKLSDMLNKSPEKSAKELAAMIRPRKLKLDKTLHKYKMNKSLPVSPVSEECRFADFVDRIDVKDDVTTRRSFSYFVDFNKDNETDKGFRQICDDIEKFSKDFNKNYDEFENIFDDDKPDWNKNEDECFSSDSLEDCSFNSTKNKKPKTCVPPRRCVSNNEIYKYETEERDHSDFYHAYDCDLPKTESFYLNQSNRNSQDSILSDDNDYDYRQSKSYCNSLESILSNESDCKSAPLEILFTHKRECGEFSKSLPKNATGEFFDLKRSQTFACYGNLNVKCNMRTSQTQTDVNFPTPEEIVAKKTNLSEDFQKKLLKFETCIAQNDKPKLKPVNLKQPVAFFVDAEKPITKDTNKNKPDKCSMYIPSLASKNNQYKSKFCNVLNNKPELNLEIFESKNKNFTLTNLNFERNKNQIQETSSLDRHLLSKGLLDAEKICHKPPKPVRRHSSKHKKTKTYEYIKKEDFFRDSKNKKFCVMNNKSNENLAPTVEKTIEFYYKEKNFNEECENGNLFNELYDSLDKPFCSTKIEQDSLEVNINQDNGKIFDSLEIWTKNPDEYNVWKDGSEDKCRNYESKSRAMDRIQLALENIKILNEIQKKIHKINNLVDIFKQNVCVGKVRALSTMYENLTNSKSFHNDLDLPKVKFRRRNLSLPNFVERRLNFETKETTNVDGKKIVEAKIDNSKAKTKNLSKGDRCSEKVQLNSDTQDNGNLRRSCSLSDLSIQSPSPVQLQRKIEQVSGKLPKKSSGLERSRSIGVLNQSDSDNESMDRKSQSRLMRPTISSLNKSSGTKRINARKRMTHSLMNLSTVGQEDSSSEEGNKIVQPKTVVPPPRTRNAESKARNQAQNKKDKVKANTHVDLNSTLTSESVATVELSTQRCEEVALQLIEAANRVSELNRRLTHPETNDDKQIPSFHRSNMLKALEISIVKTQKIFQDRLTTGRFRPSDGDINQTDAVKKLNDMVSKGVMNDQNMVVSMMQHYSDVLLGLMQQKIHDPDT